MKLDDRKVVELNLDDILPNRFQPRITFSEDAINELSESIKEHGVIQPIVVRKINDKYEIIAGERRYKASLMAGKATIPAIVTDLNDKESAEIALIENVQREDLTPIEEAVSYRKILDMGYLTQEELSSKLGKQQSTISNKLRLLNLDEEVQEALLEKKISERHARSLLRLEEKDQRMMLNRIMKERLTVRKADIEIDALLNQQKKNEEISEIEILDLDEKEEKGENNMNEGMNNNFNIPTSPIIEDNNMTNGIQENKAVNVATQSNVNEPNMIGSFTIPSTPVVEDIRPMEPAVNPGFMDVDKIANTATDINVAKSPVDLDSLLKPTDMPVTPTPQNIEPTPVDASIFGFTPSSQPAAQQPIDTSANNVETTSVAATQTNKFFDFGSFTVANDDTNEGANTALNPLDQPVGQTLQTEEVATPKPEVVVEPNTSSMFGINLEPKNPDFVSNVESKETNMNFDIPKPEVNPNNFNFDSFFTPDSIQNESSKPVEEATPVSPIQTPIQTQLVGENTAQNTNGVNNTQSNEMTMNPVEMPVQPSPLVEPTPATQPVQTDYTVPSGDELDAFLSNLDSTTPLSNIASQMNLESNSTVVVPASEISTPSNVQVNLDQIITIIHEAKAKIEALGIKVDVDEFDFDDMYQAIIKIDK